MCRRVAADRGWVNQCLDNRAAAAVRCATRGRILHHEPDADCMKLCREKAGIGCAHVPDTHEGQRDWREAQPSVVDGEGQRQDAGSQKALRSVQVSARGSSGSFWLPWSHLQGWRPTMPRRCLPCKP